VPSLHPSHLHHAWNQSEISFNLHELNLPEHLESVKSNTMELVQGDDIGRMLVIEIDLLFNIDVDNATIQTLCGFLFFVNNHSGKSN
jgi:hypothetical protein